MPRRLSSPQGSTIPATTTPSQYKPSSKRSRRGRAARHDEGLLQKAEDAAGAVKKSSTYGDDLRRAVLGMLGFPVAPFLTTQELLRVSETCTWLLPYRGQHFGFKVGW